LFNNEIGNKVEEKKIGGVKMEIFALMCIIMGVLFIALSVITALLAIADRDGMVFSISLGLTIAAFIMVIAGFLLCDHSYGIISGNKTEIVGIHAKTLSPPLTHPDDSTKTILVFQYPKDIGSEDLRGKIVAVIMPKNKVKQVTTCEKSNEGKIIALKDKGGIYYQYCAPSPPSVSATSPNLDSSPAQ